MNKLLVGCVLLVSGMSYAGDGENRSLVASDLRCPELFEKVPETPEHKEIVQCALGVSIIFMMVGDYCRLHPYDVNVQGIYRNLNTLICRAVAGKYATAEELKKDSVVLGLTRENLKPYLK